MRCRWCQNENIFSRELHKENVPRFKILAGMYIIIIIGSYVKRLKRLYGYSDSGLRKQYNSIILHDLLRTIGGIYTYIHPIILILFLYTSTFCIIRVAVI